MWLLLADGTTKLIRSMAIVDGPNGVVRYPWIPSDWDTGNLVVGSGHVLEVESVLGNSRLSFPNDGTIDQLIITEDIADGAAP